MKRHINSYLLAGALLVAATASSFAQAILVTNTSAAYGQSSYDFGPVTISAFYGETEVFPNAVINSSPTYIGVNASGVGTDPNVNAINEADTNYAGVDQERLRLEIESGHALNNLTWQWSRADGPLSTDGVTISGFSSDPGAVFGGGISGTPTYSAGKVNFQITGFNANIRSVTFTNLAASDGATLEITAADSTQINAQLALMSMTFLPTADTLLSSTFDGSSGATSIAAINNTSGTNAVGVPWTKASSVSVISNLTAISTGDSGTLGGFVQLSTAPVLADGHNLFINRNLNLDTNRFTSKRGFRLNFSITNSASLTRLTVLAGHATGAAADQGFESTLVYELSGGTLGAPVTGSSFENYGVNPVYHTVNFNLLGTSLGAGDYTLDVYQTGMTNAGGGGYSIYDGIALFSTNVPLSILTQPVPATRYEQEGTNVLSAIAAGPGPLFYQWYKSPATPVAGGTNATLTIPNLLVANAGNYYLKVTNTLGGSVTSDTVSLTVNPWVAPTFTTNPSPVSAYANQTVNFSALATGSPVWSLFYQWNKGGTPIPNATNTTLTLNNITAADVATYTCVASNGVGSPGTSTGAALTLLTLTPGTYAAATLNSKPLIYHRYSDVASSSNVFNFGSLAAAGNGNLSPDASYYYFGGPSNEGPKPPDYPNFESGNPCPYFDNFAVNGNIPPLGVISNRATITAWVNLQGAQDANDGIVLQRGGSGGCGLIVRKDSTGTFDTLGYMWNDNRWNITNDTLALPQGVWAFVAVVIEPTQATLYLQDGTNMLTKVDVFTHANANFAGTTCVGWDINGGIGSRRFGGKIDEVTIHARALSSSEVYSLFAASSNYPPAIVSAPQNATNYTGLPFSLSVTAQGTPPMSYQWYKQGSGSISGATNDLYSVSSAVIGDTGDYFVIVTNLYGAATSALAHVEAVAQAPLLTSVPQSVTNWVGLDATFSVSALGSGPLSYQWSKVSMGTLSGQTNTTLSISNLVLSDAGSYFVTVTNPVGSSNSPVATLTVLDANEFTQMLFPTNGYTGLNTVFGGFVGSTFQMGGVNRTITHLGYYDDGGDGLVNSHGVGIFTLGNPVGSGTLLAQVSVPAGTSAGYTNGYRWVALSTPLVLTNGESYMIAANCVNSASDPWPLEWLVDWNEAYVGYTAAGTRVVYYSPPGPAWPTQPSLSAGQAGKAYGAYNLMSVPSAPVTPVTLLIEKVGGDVKLTWPQGTLQAAGEVTGTYTNVPAAVSPYTVPATNSRTFFRVKVN